MAPDGTCGRFKREMGLVFYEARYYINVLKIFYIILFEITDGLFKIQAPNDSILSQKGSNKKSSIHCHNNTLHRTLTPFLF